MAKLQQIDLPFQRPFGIAMGEALAGLAHSIGKEPGLRRKIWTEDATGGRAGGIYLFDDQAGAAACPAMHDARLAAFGITGIEAKVLDVNPALTRITRGPAA